MRSDFASARGHLELAFDCLRGADNTSEKMREAIAMLIEAALTEEFARRDDVAKVLPFRR